MRQRRAVQRPAPRPSTPIAIQAATSTYPILQQPKPLRVTDTGPLASRRPRLSPCRGPNSIDDQLAREVSGEELAEVLVIEIIKAKFGRLATMLTVAGAIVDGPGIGSQFDRERLRERLRDLLLDGPGVVSEDFFWDSVVDAASPVESGGVPALLAALLVLVPQALAVGDGKLNIAGLVPPPVGPDGSDYWRRLLVPRWRQ
jgi:hypothetical protein